MGTDPIDELVARASRVKEGAFADVRVDARARDALAELFTLGRGDAAALPAATPSRRRMRRGVVAGIIAAVLTATTAAATGWISARTGVEAGGGENGTGEMIRLDGSDLGEVIDRLSRGIPLPPGGSFDRWEKKLDPGQTSTSGLEKRHRIRRLVPMDDLLAGRLPTRRYGRDGPSADRSGRDSRMASVCDRRDHQAAGTARGGRTAGGPCSVPAGLRHQLRPHALAGRPRGWLSDRSPDVRRGARPSM